MDGNNVKKMRKMANSRKGYIALPWQLASFCKGWVGDRCCDRSTSYIVDHNMNDNDSHHLERCKSPEYIQNTRVSIN